MGSTQWGSFLHNEAKGHMPSLPKTAVSEVGGREQSLIQQQLLLIFLSLYRSLAGRNLYRNASKNILKTWPPLMRKLSGDSCPHQLQTWLLQFDGLRSWCSTETAICSGEQARGLICTNCFQHILLNTNKFNFTSHWRSLSPPVWPGDNVEAAFTTSATALDASTKQTCLPCTCISWYCFLWSCKCKTMGQSLSVLLQITYHPTGMFNKNFTGTALNKLWRIQNASSKKSQPRDHKRECGLSKKMSERWQPPSSDIVPIRYCSFGLRDWGYLWKWGQKRFGLLDAGKGRPSNLK